MVSHYIGMRLALHQPFSPQRHTREHGAAIDARLRETEVCLTLVKVSELWLA